LPFRATFRGVGAFPTPHRPSVLWVGVSDEPAVMADLHRRLDEGLAEIGVERESKGFHSHLTLGRVNRPRPLPALAKRAPAYEDHVFGSIEVREIMLMRSELTPSGPIYTPVSRHALGKTA
jgi:2'-5' RNA ligase